MRHGAVWRNALGALLAVTWALCNYLAGTGAGPADLRVAVAGVPLLAALALVAWQWRRFRALGLLATAAATAAMIWAWPWLRTHVTWLLCLQHLGMHLTLGAWFGLSLTAGREPLVTAMARLIHTRPLTPQTVRYTRRVTWLWTLFFLFNAALSLALFAWAPVEVWSLHANLLTGPLVAVVFMAELLVRRVVLPHEERPSLREMLRSYQLHSRQARACAERGATQS